MKWLKGILLTFIIAFLSYQIIKDWQGIREARHQRWIEEHTIIIKYDRHNMPVLHYFTNGIEYYNWEDKVILRIPKAGGIRLKKWQIRRLFYGVWDMWYMPLKRFKYLVGRSNYNSFLVDYNFTNTEHDVMVGEAITRVFGMVNITAKYEKKRSLIAYTSYNRIKLIRNSPSIYYTMAWEMTRVVGVVFRYYQYNPLLLTCPVEKHEEAFGYIMWRFVRPYLKHLNKQAITAGYHYYREALRIGADKVAKEAILKVNDYYTKNNSEEKIIYKIGGELWLNTNM